MRRWGVMLPAALAAAMMGLTQPTDDVPVPARLEAASSLVQEVITKAIDGARAAPGDPAAWYQLARSYHANGYEAEAEACYLKAVELGREDAVLWHLVAHVRQGRGDYEGALAAADASIRLDPTHAYIHWRRGDWLLDLGRLDEAEGAYKNTLLRQANHEGALFGLVRVYLQRREPEIAISLLEGGLLDGLNGLYGHLLLGTAYRQSGRMEEAAAEMARGRGAKPAFPDPRVNELHELSTGYVNEMNRLLAAMRKGEHERVLTRTAELAKHFPDDALILEYRAATLWAMGRRSEAAQTWRAAMQVDPENHHPHLSFARTISRGTQPDSQVFALALSHAVRATELNPNDAEAFELVGTMYGFAQQLGPAVEALERATAVDPKRASAIGKLGELYLQQQRWEEAYITLERLISLQPDAGAGYVLLAQAAIETRRYVEATTALDTAERIFPQAAPRIMQLRGMIPKESGPP